MRFTTTTALSYLLGLVAALPTQLTTSPTPTASTVHLEIRQGAVVTAAAPASILGQVSPTTTVQIGYMKNGAYVQTEEIYTQTFKLPLDQWPSATQGAIGLGTIQGKIGVLRKLMEEVPVEDEAGFAAKDLILTTEEFNKISAAMPPEHAAEGENQDVVITKELLHMLIN